MILIDTQILVWWTTGEAPKSTAQQAAMERFDVLRTGGVAASAISVWEIALLIERGRLEFGGDIQQWFTLASGIRYLTFLPLTADIALRSRTELGDFAHNDPADRFILATAVTHGLQLLTTDEKLRAYPGEHVIALP